jgi:hypothetical protein
MKRGRLSRAGFVAWGFSFGRGLELRVLSCIDPLGDGMPPISRTATKRTESADFPPVLRPPRFGLFAAVSAPFESYDRTPENRGVASSILALATDESRIPAGRRFLVRPRRRPNVPRDGRRKGDARRHAFGPELRDPRWGGDLGLDSNRRPHEFPVVVLAVRCGHPAGGHACHGEHEDFRALHKGDGASKPDHDAAGHAPT